MFNYFYISQGQRVHWLTNPPGMWLDQVFMHFSLSAPNQFYSNNSFDSLIWLKYRLNHLYRHAMLFVWYIACYFTYDLCEATVKLAYPPHWDFQPKLSIGSLSVIDLTHAGYMEFIYAIKHNYWIVVNFYVSSMTDKWVYSYLNSSFEGELLGTNTSYLGLLYNCSALKWQRYFILCGDNLVRWMSRLLTCFLIAIHYTPQLAKPFIFQYRIHTWCKVGHHRASRSPCT